MAFSLAKYQYKTGGNIFYDTMMVNYQKTLCLDYSCITPFRDTPVIDFLASDRFIGRIPPTVQELQRQLELENTRYINMLRYFARNIKGSDDSWRACTDDLEQWINHHVGRGHGPPTFFVTLSCAKNWWPDLRHLVYQFEVIGGHYIKAQAIKHGCRKAMSNATRKFPLYVNNFL